MSGHIHSFNQKIFEIADNNNQVSQIIAKVSSTAKLTTAEQIALLEARKMIAENNIALYKATSEYHKKALNTLIEHNKDLERLLSRNSR